MSGDTLNERQNLTDKMNTPKTPIQSQTKYDEKEKSA